MSKIIAIGVGGSLLGGYVSGKGAKDAAQIGADANSLAAQLEQERYLQGRQDLSPYREVAIGEEIYTPFDEALSQWQADRMAAWESLADSYAGDYKGREEALRIWESENPRPWGDQFEGYTGGALNELADYGRSRVQPGDYIPQSDIPVFDTQGFNIDFWKDPSYEWRKEEMLRGLDRTSGATGKITSGNRLNEIMQRVGDMASQEYGAAFGRYKNQYAADTAREADLYRRGVGEYGLAYGEEGDYLNRLAALSNVGQTASDTGARLGVLSGASQADKIAAAGASQASGVLGQSQAWGNAISDITQLAGRAINQPPAYRPPAPTTPGLNYSPVQQQQPTYPYWNP